MEELPDGPRDLADARIRHEILRCLHAALRASGINQADLARRLGVRRSAVNQVFKGDGNVRISTVAQYLHALGFELGVQLYEDGEHRRATVENRESRPAGTGDTGPADNTHRRGQSQPRIDNVAAALTPVPLAGTGNWSIREDIRPIRAAFTSVLGLESSQSALDPGQQRG
ncbi:helix-turn-helix domain-containing protein [Frankia alni]|uniref:helix-turn-helix domain-containing protein n=1 Tax=Frankia alni TaxID=1859 RepID=UPI0012FFA00E